MIKPSPLQASIGLALLLGFAVPVAGLAGPQKTKDATFTKALRSKSADELMTWGARYERGDGIEQDLRKALQLYCRAADRGEPKAALQLGQLYAFGRGIHRDRELAAAWFHVAARKRDPAALNMLKVLKVDGKPRRKPECLLDPPTPSATPLQAFKHHPAKGEVAEMVRELAPIYGLDANLVLAVIEAESNFNPRARSHKNAQGLMQLIPATAERFGVRNPWDPEQNMRGGMAYLRWLLRYFDGDVTLALAGYNAGEGAVDKYGGVPPFAETRAYVKKIIERIN